MSGGQGNGPDGSEASVLVVGAGPIGLTTAIELTRHGVPVRIIDKVPPRPLFESRATGTNARTLELWDRFGLTEHIIEYGHAMRGISAYTDGQRIGRARIDGLDSPFPYFVMYPQSESERLLIEHAERLGVKVERPAELVDYAQDDEQVVATVRAADGTDEQIAVRYLIGCDGAQSRVRKLMGQDFEGVEIRGAFLIDCVVDWPGGGPEDGGQNYLGKGSDIILWQNPGGITRVVVSLWLDDPRMRLEPPTVESMQRLLNEEGIDVRLSNQRWGSSFKVSNRLVKKWRDQRVFLAGDAAHIHDPTGGQGMNSGVVDAFNLSWKLALVLDGVGSDELLDSYQAERLPMVEKLLTTVERAARTLTSRGRLGPRLRKQFLSVGTSVERLQDLGRRSVSGFTVRYRKSPIVLEHRRRLRRVPYHGKGEPVLAARLGARHDYRRAPRAGDRIPDARDLTTADIGPRRLYEILGDDPRHVLLVPIGLVTQPSRVVELQRFVAEVDARWGAFVRARLVVTPPGGDGPLELRDCTYQLHHRLGAKWECMYLIRPDSYVGLRSRHVEIDVIESYLRDSLGLPAP